jgi:hypothetical protein
MKGVFYDFRVDNFRGGRVKKTSSFMIIRESETVLVVSGIEAPSFASFATMRTEVSSTGVDRAPAM